MPTFKNVSLKDIPVVEYKNIREKLNSGDLIFFAGVKIGDWFIKIQAKMDGHSIPFSHVAVIRRDFNRVKIMEAVMPISREINLSNYLLHFKGDVVFTKMMVDNVDKDNPELRQKVIETAIDLLGIDYENPVVMGFSFILDNFSKITGTKRVYCSEFSRTVWAKNDIPYLQNNENPSPSECYDDPLIVPIGRLKAPIKLS